MKGYLQSLPVVGKIFLDVQPEEVWAFWRFMQDHFRTSVINKNSALEMQLVARGLEALGIQSKDRFLKNFTTTIGRRIYTPFEVGSPKGGWDSGTSRHLRARAPARRAARSRGAGLRGQLPRRRAARARWEAEAYRSNLELQFWRTAPRPRPAHRLGAQDYGCRDGDIEVTAKSLALSALSVKKGAVINEATHCARLARRACAAPALQAGERWRSRARETGHGHAAADGCATAPASGDRHRRAPGGPRPAQ
jgi:hypothetical protein